MATVYILYSQKLNKFYVGSCLNLTERISEHQNKKYADAFTAKAEDWILYFVIGELGYEEARKIETHIKKMKSKQYIENLKKYDGISQRLKQQYH